MQILTIWGLGGAGKSQLVLHYIQEFRKDYKAVFWIEAGSKETIERDYIQIYSLLYGRPTRASPETATLKDAVAAVKRWFQNQEGRWLVVLDSADTIDNEQDQAYIDLAYFLPDAPGVHIIITSRSSTAQEVTGLAGVAVGEMEPLEAIELFQRAAKMTQAGPEAREEMGRMMEELGYLALAITLAGSYVSMTPRLQSDITRYLPEYRWRRKELLQRRPKQHMHRYGESVLGTWETSFEAIAKQDLAAARLLSLLAFVNFEDIFMSLFGGEDSNAYADGLEHITGESKAAGIDQPKWQSYLSGGRQWTLYDLESALETLQSYCMLQWRSDQRSYAMHKLVQAWGHDRLEVEEQRPLSGLALELMADATSKGEADPSQRLRLVPHVMACFGAFSRVDPSPDEVGRDDLGMIDRMGDFLYRMGRWSETYEIRVFHSTQVEAILGKQHPSTLTSMNNLALVLNSQGKYEEAEQMHRQTLALSESELGKKHPSTLTSMNNLARVLDRQGKYEEAEQMHRQTLALRESELGKKHPETLGSVYCLAYLLHGVKRYKDAELMYQRACAGYRATLGDSHPTTTACLQHYLSMCWEANGES